MKHGLTLFALLLVPLATLHAADATGRQPNILLILADDRAEQHEFAAKLPDKVKELEQAWQRQTDSFSKLARKTSSK